MAASDWPTIPNPLVVFGYGSLIFKPPPHTVAQAPGYLKGYVRRFAQASHDHRGTPEAPGRVVTLVHTEDWETFSAADQFPHEDVVWGVAYTIDQAHAKDVLAYLDHREKDGYTAEKIEIHGYEKGHGSIIFRNALCYVGHNTNPSFVGSEPIDQLAAHIHRSVGPSGPNKEYLYALVEAVRDLAPEAHDSHLFALETRCRELDEEERARSSVRKALP